MNAHQKMSSKGGKAGRGESKARTSDQARKAARQRWINELSACELVSMHARLAEYVGGLEERVAMVGAVIKAGENINAEFCSWAPHEVRAPLFAAWDAVVSSAPNKPDEPRP
jgi:hypothetical protein